jgi:hypothetical protein
MPLTRHKRPLNETVNIPANEPQWLTRRRKVPVAYAANLRGLSEDTFRRTHPGLIEDISDRRQGVELGRVLDLSNTEG